MIQMTFVETLKRLRRILGVRSNPGQERLAKSVSLAA